MLLKRLFVLTGCAVPLILLQMNPLAGCVPGSVVGVTQEGGGLIFNLPPLPIVTADVVRGVVPLRVRFDSATSTDDGLILSRSWDFGDGTTSPDIAPSHVFADTGDFTVALTLTDDLGAQATRSILVSVTNAPVARIAVDRTAAESAPALITFDASASFDSDGEIVQYQWDFGDGSRELVSVVAHTFARAGTFRTKLTVTDDKGITGVDEVIIEVGIRAPTIELRVPPATVSNIVVSPDSSIFIQAVFNTEPGVPFMTRAGLDGDTDICNAQTIVLGVESGVSQLTLLGHDAPITAVAFDPGGGRVLTAGTDAAILLFDLGSGFVLRTFAVAAPVTSLDFSPNGDEFVYGDVSGGVVVLDVSNGAVVRTFAGHSSRTNAVAFSPDGAQVLSGGNDRRAILWQITDGTILRDFTHGLAVNDVAFSPTDQTIIAAASSDETTKLWNVTSGELLNTLDGHAGGVNAVAFAPDGTMLATGGADRRIKIWASMGGTLLRTIDAHSGNVVALDYSSDGTLITSGGADGRVRVWDAATGEQLQSARPCSSTISSVAFSPDDTQVAAGVAAENDIQLDAADSPNGNDLNLTYPVALDVGDVPEGEYRLWVEIDTDRTDPVRAYSNVFVNVVAPFTDTISAATPLIPLVNDSAAVLLSPTTDRQIFDVGLLQAGDRVFINLLRTPGYIDAFDDELFSLMILDADESVFAWYQNDFILFTPDAKSVIGHTSPSYFVVVDGGQSINVRIEREFGSTPRQQRILLDFRGQNGLVIAGQPAVNVPEFDANDLNAAWGATETAILKTTIAQTVRNLFAPWNVDIMTSDEGIPDPPFQTMYVGADNFFLFGIADYIDPRNETLTGRGITYAESIAAFYPGDTATQLGARIGSIAGHECGHLLGLRHVDNSNDIMTGGGDVVPGLGFSVSPLSAFEQINSPGIGNQDAPQLFDEIFGPS